MNIHLDQTLSQLSSLSCSHILSNLFSNLLHYVFPKALFFKIHKGSTCFILPSRHLSPGPVGWGCGLKRHCELLNKFNSVSLQLCRVRTYGGQSVSMKKVYSLVNVSKAKNQGEVKSICIKVSLHFGGGVDSSSYFSFVCSR